MLLQLLLAGAASIGERPSSLLSLSDGAAARYIYGVPRTSRVIPTMFLSVKWVGVGVEVPGVRRTAGSARPNESQQAIGYVGLYSKINVESVAR